jgi:hypothetical protein
MARVLHFEASRRCDLGSQTAPTWAVRPAWVATPASSSLLPQFCGSTEKPSGFVVNHYKPRRLGAASHQPPLMT